MFLQELNKLKVQDEGFCTSRLPITFGSDLPPLFSSIPEEGEGTSAAPHAPIHLDAFGPMGTTPVVRRLQFSTMTSASETPEEKPIFKEHRLPQRGQTLEYIAPSSNQGKRVVTLVEADLKPQEDY
ncbi:hypothetical protein KY290_008148 [Solanum tuberosum]|uniref:Integrase core domain containing protein n=1 Tax=Solanum tuberosum TaxID=4113 RepID=A0ABQ7W7M1_SOLTU|nr:hypothetical protein KY290_008148 [Solanum tuberosum]